MKKLMLIAAMMVVSVCANAQMFVKPMVGGTLSTITGDNTDNYKFKVGLVAGGEFGYFITDKFAATAGLLYTMEGTKIKHADHNTNLEYLNIPVLANYYIIPGLAVKAGIQPGFLTKAKHGDTDIKEDCKKLDISIPIGVSYDISDFVIDARYNLGVANINDYDHSPSQKNSFIMLTVGYKIPL